MAVYIVYDPDRLEYLASFKKPVKGVDAAVTMWTVNRTHAMRFKVYAAAIGAAVWLGGGLRAIEEEGARE